MPTLSQAEIASRLTARPHWRIDGSELVRTFQFENFRDAVTFVNKVAGIAEDANHHPDIDIRYNRVRLALISHDAGGLTDRDFALAGAADRLV